MAGKKFNYEVKVQRELDKDDIKDILATAFEGGIGYWACIGNDDKYWEEACKKIKKKHHGELPYYSDVAYEVLNSGHQVVLYDIEDDDKKLKFNMDDLLRACALWEENFDGGCVSKALEDGELDAEVADCIIQLAVFDDVIYG